MKRITAIALLAIANFALAGTSYAQSTGVRAEVPFSFAVGDKVLPAGNYTIKSESPHVIVIKNHDHPAEAALSLVNQASNGSPNGGKLLFQKYGSQYFLSEILCNSADMNLSIPPSKREKRAQRQQATLERSSTTLVAYLTR
jgi:hypothetical protein